MKEELEAEAKDDEEVYEQLTCWCETNRKEKEAAIEAGKAKIEQLESSIEELTAKIAELTEHYNGQRGEMYKNDKAKKDATGMRMKEGQEFHKEETDLINAINACKHAITVLSKHHPELLQLTGAAKELRKVSAHLLSEVLTATQHDTLKSFLRIAEGSSADSFLQKDAIPGMQSYAPQSGQIFGILKQMKEDFEKNLSEEQKEELAAQEAFANLKAAKEEEMAAQKKAIAQFEQDLAETMEKHAAAEEDLADTKAALSDDETFLLSLLKKCKESEAEYQERSKEISACADVIVILNSDEAFDNFGKTTGFVQLNSSAGHASTLQRQQRQRESAMKVLQNAAAKTNDPRLVLLASNIRIDAFYKVIKAIDDMVKELKAQQAEEVEHNDWCTGEFNQNLRQTDAKTDERVDLETKIDDLKQTIKTLTTDIEALKGEIEEMKTQMKRASEDRENENADFQTAVSDQRITQQILKKALARMQQVYLQYSSRTHRRSGHHAKGSGYIDTLFAETEEPDQPGAPHTQTSATRTDPGSGPARYTKYEKKKGGSKIVQMLQSVLHDSEMAEAEASTSERDAQRSYEDFMQDSNKGIDQRLRTITNKTEEKAKADEEKTMAEGDHAQAMQALESLNNYKNQLHDDCDFILRNFEVRQEARAQEMDALGQAKAILSGMGRQGLE